LHSRARVAIVSATTTAVEGIHVRRVPALRLVLLVHCLLAAACAMKTVPMDSPTYSNPVFAADYKVGIGDNLKVDVYGNPDLSVSVPVRPDGRITVPVAGDVLVGGKTPEAVSREIAAALSEYIRDPIVTTTVVSMGGNEFLERVRVTGAAQSPTSLPYTAGMTVLDAVLQCGGPNEFARLGNVVLNRATGERLAVRLDRILKGVDMRTNYPVLPGDVIHIPLALF